MDTLVPSQIARDAILNAGHRSKILYKSYQASGMYKTTNTLSSATMDELALVTPQDIRAGFKDSYMRVIEHIRVIDHNSSPA